MQNIKYVLIFYLLDYVRGGWCVMRGRERRYVWFSLILAGALCISDGLPIWANEELAGDGTESSKPEEIISDNSDDFETVSGNDDVWSVLVDVVSDQNEIVLSQNKTNSENSLSENRLPLDVLSSDSGFSVVSDADNENEEEMKDEILNVVLPTEIPLDIILIGKEGVEGIINSEQFCVENRGYEDVCISFQGSCSGNNEKDYVIGRDFTRNGIVDNKKNVWIYLKWEDENGDVLEGEPKILMGDVSDPGEGAITLKAPERDEAGMITGENDGSRAFFSFAGDLQSAMGERWEDEELSVNLNFSIKTVKPIQSIDDMEMPNEAFVFDEFKDEMGGSDR